MRDDVVIDDFSAVVLRPVGSCPATGWPAVIVLYEAYGTTPAMVDAAQRFADDGYVAVLPDMLGGRGMLCLARGIREVMSGRPGAVSERIESTRYWLTEQSDVDSERVGVAGFCIGGGFALLYAGTGAPVRAAGVNYGAVPADDEPLRNACPVVASFGGRDRVLAARAATLAQRLSALGVVNDVRVYPEAGHSFMTPDRHPVWEALLIPAHLGYTDNAAHDAWGRMLTFFDTHVRGGGVSDVDTPPSSTS